MYVTESRGRRRPHRVYILTQDQEPSRLSVCICLSIRLYERQFLNYYWVDRKDPGDFPYNFLKIFERLLTLSWHF